MLHKIDGVMIWVVANLVRIVRSKNALRITGIIYAAQFGDEYRSYQRRVPRAVPWRGRLRPEG